MVWKVEFKPKAEKQLGKLDRQTQQAIVKYMERVGDSGDPKASGKPLVGELTGLWRYRVGKYRIICEIVEKRLVIEVIKIGKRDKVYD